MGIESDFDLKETINELTDLRAEHAILKEKSSSSIMKLKNENV